MGQKLGYMGKKIGNRGENKKKSQNLREMGKKEEKMGQKLRKMGKKEEKKKWKLGEKMKKWRKKKNGGKWGKN